MMLVKIMTQFMSCHTARTYGTCRYIGTGSPHKTKTSVYAITPGGENHIRKACGFNCKINGSGEVFIVKKNADGRWTANIIKLTWIRYGNCSNLPEVIKSSVCLYGLEIRMLKSSFRIHISSINRDFWRGGKCCIF